MLLAAAALFRLASARRELVQARVALDDGRAALARGRMEEASGAFDAAEHRLWAARSASGFPLAVISPVPLAGSPGRAVGDTVAAGLHVVAAGRDLAQAERAFPTVGGTGLDGADLSAMHKAALDARAPFDRAQRELTDAERALRGPAGAALPPVSSPARGVLPVLAETRRQLDGARRGLGLLADLTAPTADARILVLSQDTLEGRPTGGFIGTIGLLHLRTGRCPSRTTAPPASSPSQARGCPCPSTSSTGCTATRGRSPT